MTPQEPFFTSQPSTHGFASHLRRVLLYALVVGLLALAAAFTRVQSPAGGQSDQDTAAAPSLTATATAGLPPTSEEPAPTLQPAEPVPVSDGPAVPAGLSAPRLSQELSLEDGPLFLGLQEGDRSHLFTYHPQLMPLTRLTAGPWDDAYPALDPNGSRLAFASNRQGQWDLYVLDLMSGEIQRVTETPEYDASPSWSPDGKWLAYESYSRAEPAGLDIYLVSLEGDQKPVRLTDHPGADYAPAWSPQGRQVAFVSNRTGDREVWLADLDQSEERFVNLSQNAEAEDDQPAWNPDGSRLAWASEESGSRQVVLGGLSSGEGLVRPRVIGEGSEPAWSPDGQFLAAIYRTPNQEYLTGYAVDSTGLLLPPVLLKGQVKGLAWGSTTLPEAFLAAAAGAIQAEPTALFQPALTGAGQPEGRFGLSPIGDTEALYPLLQDQVDEAFLALRSNLASRIGWDYLATLENAYLPLTAPLSPGMHEDWLYTGRAFAINQAPLQAGWMAVVREDFGSKTYWRIFLRARMQDGTQGAPLYTLPWNFGARSSGDPRYYEEGGALAEEIPEGYWLDFTCLASQFGWERLPALNAWKYSYSAARYNEFVLTGGLDWLAAMREIYPESALATPTPVPTATNTLIPSSTPTRTPIPTRTPVPTRTPRPTHTSTPTRTPTATLLP